MSEEGAKTASLVSLSRVLSKVLRHEPEYVDAKLDNSGWIDIDILVRCLNSSSRKAAADKRLRTLGTVTAELVVRAAQESSKQRFGISADGHRIRAVQGHSIEVDLQYPLAEPPSQLFHGTASISWNSIDAEGLRPMERQHVHLSSDVPTARSVGMRHGRPIVLAVAAGDMHRAGEKFWLAENGVWLTEAVPREYITLRNEP